MCFFIFSLFVDEKNNNEEDNGEILRYLEEDYIEQQQ